MRLNTYILTRRVGVSASHAVGRRFAHRPSHTKDQHKKVQTRVGYCIPGPDFYRVLHGLRCRKST